MVKKVQLDFHGRPLSIEVGRLAKQADGAALVQYGETVVLVTAVADKDVRLDTDFFPPQMFFPDNRPSAGRSRYRAGRPCRRPQ